MPLIPSHINQSTYVHTGAHRLYSDRITCAYLFTITQHGYPPDAQHTLQHIDEMASLGFTSIELEGIGEKNINYLSQHRLQIADKLATHQCTVPVFCIVLPQLSSTDADKRNRSLELFEKGCELAHALGAQGVLDNGPLLPLQFPANMPVMRHYSSHDLVVPPNFNWDSYYTNLVQTFRTACNIAAGFQLQYHMHPCEGSLITGTDSFINFSDAVDCDNLMFNLDTANQFFMKDHLELSVLRLIHKISYIHISDNSGERVEHSVPGQGKINWNNFFSALQQAGFTGKLAIDVGGAETGIEDIQQAYRQTAAWLDEKINSYLLN